MSLFSDLLKYTGKVTNLANQVDGLSTQIKELTALQHEFDRRLVRIETIVELAREQARNRRLSGPER